MAKPIYYPEGTDYATRGIPTHEPLFKAGDRVSCYSSYWGRQTGVVTNDPPKWTHNMDGSRKDNYGYWVILDGCKTRQCYGEGHMKKCRKG